MVRDKWGATRNIPTDKSRTHSDQNMIKAKIHKSTHFPRLLCCLYHLDLLLMVHFQESVLLPIACPLQLVWELQESAAGSGTSERLQRPRHSELHQRFFYCRPLTRLRYGASRLLPGKDAGAVGTPNPFHMCLDLKKERACTWTCLSWRMAWNIGKDLAIKLFMLDQKRSGKIVLSTQSKSCFALQRPPSPWNHLRWLACRCGLTKKQVCKYKLHVGWQHFSQTQQICIQRIPTSTQSKIVRVWTVFRIPEPEQAYISHLGIHLQTVMFQTPRKVP